MPKKVNEDMVIEAFKQNMERQKKYKYITDNFEEFYINSSKKRQERLDLLLDHIISYLEDFIFVIKKQR